MGQWQYISIGDSLCADDYTGVPDAGASALLFHNNNELWPEFAGQDLASHFPGAVHVDLHSNGASLEDVYKVQAREVGTYEGVELVTVAAGANDLLSVVDQLAPEAGWVDEEKLSRAQSNFQVFFGNVVQTLRELAPHATVLVNNLFDPNDGRGKAKPWRTWGGLGKFIQQINGAITAACAEHNCHVVDMHGILRAHAKGPNKHEPLLIKVVEPNALGAHTIRMAWWNKLKELGVVVG